MRPSRLSAGAFFALLLVATRSPSAQSLPKDDSEVGAVIVKVFAPTYPPLARQARIVGDVEIRLAVRQDGSIASAEAVSGHPMLKQAALESAQKSQFECRGCSDQITYYSVTYTFEIAGECHFGPHCEPLDEAEPRVTQAQRRITVTGGPACTCDPAAILVRVRSAKCLYCGNAGIAKLRSSESPQRAPILGPPVSPS